MSLHSDYPVQILRLCPALKGPDALQEELVAMGVMKPSADAALAARSAARAAKAARRLRDAQERREFRRFTTPGGLQVRRCHN